MMKIALALLQNLVVVGITSHAFMQEESVMRHLNKRKTLACLLGCMLLISAALSGCSGSSNNAEHPTATSNPAESSAPATPEAPKTPVELNGKLSVKGTQLVNEKGEALQLKGLSSHSIASYGNLVNLESLKWLRDDWGINVFRIAMYTEDASGYIRNPKIKDTVKNIVEWSREAGLYVLIDWHILYDMTPMKYKKEAVAFFDEMSSLYKDYPNVIYEICNEPNGYDTTWNDVVKPYAEEVVATIRKNDPDNIILIGSSTWSQDVDIAAENPVKGDNLMYTLHFYAGTHGQFLKDKIDKALSKGLPIFVSEWGTCDASGDGNTFHKETREWIKFLDDRKISHMNWSLSTKLEAASALRDMAPNRGPWYDTDLTESGLLVKYLIKGTPDFPLMSDGFESKTFVQGQWSRVKTSLSLDNASAGMYSASFGKDASLARGITTELYKNLKLTFQYCSDGAQAGDALIVEWSADGNTWNKLEEIAPTDQWTEKMLTLPEDASGKPGFAFRLSSKIGGEGKILVDDVLLTATLK